MDTIQRIERKLIHKGAIVSFYEDTMRLPDGRCAKWDYLEHKGAAAIVAVDLEGKILMVRQYRGAVEKNTLEIPAGGRNEGEDFKVCAIRELEEETGFATKDAELLLELFTTVAFCDEKIAIYMTEDIVPSKQNLDEDEYVTIERYTLEELVNMILSGTIQDAKTISAILAYKAKKEQKNK
ncbi:MAG: ADP-ribose pyrophosphatase [Clostridiales bacterium]|nr:ADP-ribose pyrophosphatase [Clostridiales bacterium]